MPSQLVQFLQKPGGTAFNIHHQAGRRPLCLGAQRILQRRVVATAAQGKLPVEKAGAQVMILRHQNDKRGVSFARLADGLAQKFESVEKGGSKRRVRKSQCITSCTPPPVTAHCHSHGLPPGNGVLILRPCPGRPVIPLAEICACLQRQGTIAFSLNTFDEHLPGQLKAM